jgi:DMSO/TMAO reductase YedYZ molybdopterin-dependent catalytic subunit
VSRSHLTPRREFLRQAGWLAVGAALAAKLPCAFAADDTGVVGSVTLPFENGERELVVYPQKRPLIRLTTRPPQLETPFAVFNDGLVTPNDAFFVRYHLSDIPLSIDPATHRVAVRGLVKTPLSLSLADLKALGDPVEFFAVNQCSGNSRGFFSPRANGGQLGHGAMGNARWTGVPLRRVLERADVGAGAKQVTFRGLDRGLIEATPVLVKALDLDHALDGEVMIAWAMNGADLPMLNGFPIRLVVPGYYGTYWVKHLSAIEVLDHEFDGFWMAKSYRIPDNPTHSVAPGTTPTATVPINKMTVRSFITSPTAAASVPVGRELVARGIAFDSGRGIREVAFSADGGATWRAAELGAELGRYAFREWKAPFTARAPGPLRLMARATNRDGEIQPLDATWNPSGYMRNVVETVEVLAVRA